MIYNVIGDIHSREIWKECVKPNAINIFVGDYFCPYHYVPWECQKEIFLDIINFKLEHPETILLIGNHDAGHVYWNEHASRFNYEHQKDIKSLFLKYEDLFQAAYSIENKILVTHAGVSANWLYAYQFNLYYFGSIKKQDQPLSYIVKEYGDYDCIKENISNYFLKYDHNYYIYKDNDWIKQIFTPNDVADFVNKLWANNKYCFCFNANGKMSDYYGITPKHSPMWIRIGDPMFDGLRSNNIFEGTDYIQVFGHTLSYDIEYYNDRDENGKVISRLINVDCLEGCPKTFQYNSEDSRQ